LRDVRSGFDELDVYRGRVDQMIALLAEVVTTFEAQLETMQLRDEIVAQNLRCFRELSRFSGLGSRSLPAASQGGARSNWTRPMPLSCDWSSAWPFRGGVPARARA
jgi:hypothetical protein